MVRLRTRAGKRACAQRTKPLTTTKIPRISKKAKAARELSLKNLESLSPDNLYKMVDYLRRSSFKPSKVRRFTNASNVAIFRPRVARCSSETRSIDSDGASTSSGDEYCFPVTEEKEGKKKLRTTRSNPELIGKLLKKNVLRGNMKKIRWDESENQIQSERRVRALIANDPELSGFYTRQFDKKISYTQMKIMSKIIEELVRSGDAKDTKTRGTKQIKFNLKLINYIKNEIYVPPPTRIQIIAGRSSDWKSDVAVYTDIPGETLKNATSPNSLMIQYTNQNCFDKRTLSKIAKVSKTVLKCECCSDGAITKCYNNPDCPCYKRNMRLQSLQKAQNSGTQKLTKFSTFEPINIRKDSFFDTLGFACSEECGCKGRCNNNVTLLLEKNLHELEVFRKDKEMGFGIRSKTAIPRGTPVTEFTGEIVGCARNNYYEYTMFGKNEHEKIPVAFDKSETEIMEATMEAFTSRSQWIINPQDIGNVGRYFCHSCEPNLAMVRVFQKGFTPAHCRCLLVTQEVIFPGQEVTFDYGLGYVKQNLDNKCLCGKPSCTSSDLFKMMRNASGPALERYQALRYHISYSNFEKNVLDKI